jgi:hypothetical protein
MQSSDSRSESLSIAFPILKISRLLSLTWFVSRQHNKRFDYLFLRIKGPFGISSELTQHNS